MWNRWIKPWGKIKNDYYNRFVMRTALTIMYKSFGDSKNNSKICFFFTVHYFYSVGIFHVSKCRIVILKIVWTNFLTLVIIDCTTNLSTPILINPKAILIRRHEPAITVRRKSNLRLFISDNHFHCSLMWLELGGKSNCNSCWHLQFNINNE